MERHSQGGQDEVPQEVAVMSPFDVAAWLACGALGGLLALVVINVAKGVFRG